MKTFQLCWFRERGVNPCTAVGVLGYHSNVFRGAVGILEYTSKQFLDIHQKSSIFALAYHDALLMCIFFHFCVYDRKHTFWKRGKLPFFLHRRSKLFFFIANRLSTAQLCGIDPSQREDMVKGSTIALHQRNQQLLIATQIEEEIHYLPNRDLACGEIPSTTPIEESRPLMELLKSNDNLRNCSRKARLFLRDAG